MSGTADGRVAVNGHSNLWFSFTRIDDSGNYTCVVRYNGRELIRHYSLAILGKTQLADVFYKGLYKQQCMCAYVHAVRFPYHCNNNHDKKNPMFVIFKKIMQNLIVQSKTNILTFFYQTKPKSHVIMLVSLLRLKN